MGLFMIYARAANGAIGKDGALPWYIPNDLRHFKAKTMGLPMIMGRKTFESFQGPLKGRRNIVLTRSKRWKAEGAEVVHSVDEALDLVANTDCSVIGGAEIYALFEPFADRIELTEVHADFEGDTFMPNTGPEWSEVTRVNHPAEDGRPAYSFVTLERVK